MKNRIIKLLGGYTGEEHNELERIYSTEEVKLYIKIQRLEKELKAREQVIEELTKPKKRGKTK